MKTTKFDTIVRNFLLNEGEKVRPSLKSRLLSLEEMISSLVGRSMSENRKLEIVKEQLSNLKKDVRRLEERNSLLEDENKQLQEKLTILEESKEE
jgi:predicted nuclease with TOPRIM domain